MCHAHIHQPEGTRVDPHDTDPDEFDYPQIRDQIINAMRALHVGITIDPFTSPAEAHAQIPLLAGALSGIIDLRTMATIGPDDNHAHQQWMSGFHYAVTGVQEDTPEAAHYCLGIIASHLHLTCTITEFLSRHHTYAALAAALMEVAANFTAAASAGLENPEGFDPDVLAHYHKLARRAITAATTVLDAAEAHLRDTDYHIDTRN
jgi:hypothetical protein